MTTTIVAFDDFTDIDVFIAWDLFNRAKQYSREWVVRLVGTKTTHRSCTGVDIAMHGFVEECNSADIVFFTSGPGTRRLYKDPSYLNRFSLDPSKQIICSMCSGALIMGGLGLLQGITATAYPTAWSELRSLGIEVEENRRLVRHGTIATAANCLAAVDLVSWCLDRTLGSTIARKVTSSIAALGQTSEIIEQDTAGWS